jgi:hypothetical protein
MFDHTLKAELPTKVVIQICCYDKRWRDMNQKKCFLCGIIQNIRELR